MWRKLGRGRRCLSEPPQFQGWYAGRADLAYHSYTSSFMQAGHITHHKLRTMQSSKNLVLGEKGGNKRLLMLPQQSRASNSVPSNTPTLQKPIRNVHVPAPNVLT